MVSRSREGRERECERADKSSEMAVSLDSRLETRDISGRKKLILDVIDAVDDRRRVFREQV